LSNFLRVARTACLLVPALAMSVGVLSTASAQMPAAVRIDVDATAAGAPLEPVWAFYGYDEANYTTSPEGEALLRTLTAAHAAPLHVRTHFLFNTGDGMPRLKWGSTNLYTAGPGQNPSYDYTLIDAILDATARAGAFPLVEIGFMPQALSTRPIPYENSNTYALDGGCFYPPRDYDEWARLVTSWATHVKERYPGAGASWQWELWNEPDIGYWKGTFDEYARLYDYTEAALHAVFPEASLGGPAVASPERSFLTEFLTHCATGTNTVTGQTGTRLDMVSFHAKGGVSVTDGHVQMDLGNQLRLHRAGFEAVAASAFARTPIVISEADPDGCAACPVSTAPQHAYRNSPAYGAYEMAMMKRTLDLAAEVGVNLRGVLTWAFTFPGSPYFAGYRALATNGIHLPVLNALQLLGSLRGDRLPVASSGERPLRDILESSVREQPDIDALAARDGEQIRILVWHYHDDLVDAQPAPVTLRVAVPPAFGGKSSARAVRVRHTRVDATHGNAFAVWVAQGSPEPPAPPELAALREAMAPVLLDPEHVAPVSDGAVSLSFELPRFGVSLLELTPERGDEHEASAPSDSSCSCRFASAARRPLPLLLALALPIAFARRRRFTPARSGAADARAAGEARTPNKTPSYDERYPQ
jgi:xylan 1,4-beta-xylosidase